MRLFLLRHPISGPDSSQGPQVQDQNPDLSSLVGIRLVSSQNTFCGLFLNVRLVPTVEHRKPPISIVTVRFPPLREHDSRALAMPRAGSLHSRDDAAVVFAARRSSDSLAGYRRTRGPLPLTAGLSAAPVARRRIAIKKLFSVMTKGARRRYAHNMRVISDNKQLSLC